MNKLAQMLGDPRQLGNALMRPRANNWAGTGNREIPAADWNRSVLKPMADAFTLPARVYRGEADPYDIGEALNFATTLAIGGLAIPKPANSVGMFGGRGVVPRPAMPVAREGAGPVSGGLPVLPAERLRFAESHAMDDFGNKLTELFTGRKPMYQGKGWTLSANKASGPEFEYTIMQDGKPVASARGFVRGDQAEIEWIGRNRIEDKAALGVAGTRSLMDQLRRDFPDVRQFSGTRVSGAREANRAAPRQTLRRKDGWF